MDFATESGYDKLTFFDYVDGTYEQGKQFSGQSLPASFTTISNMVKVHFKTDYSGTYRGFKFTYADSDVSPGIPSTFKPYFSF